MELLKVSVRVQRAVRQLSAGRRAVSPLLPLALLFLISIDGVRAAASWTPLRNLFPGPGVQLMVQETDGTIMAATLMEPGRSWLRSLSPACIMPRRSCRTVGSLS